MKRLLLMLGLVTLGTVSAHPLMAQKVRPAPNGPDADGDGVADVTDRCPGTPALTRVGRDGCPVTLMLRPTMPAQGTLAPVTPPVANPRGAPTPANPIVTPQAAAPAVPAAPANAFTAGLALAPFPGGARDAALEYGRRIGQMLDSTIVTLVGVFRNTSGQAVAGASGPETLSARERERWGRCRDLHWDLMTYRVGLISAAPAMAGDAALSLAAAALDSALQSLRATEECDNVSSMIAAPGRWTPWQQQYETAARRFYQEWYAQIRTVHEKDRAFVNALSMVLPANRRLPGLAALPPRPPYAGGAMR